MTNSNKIALAQAGLQRPIRVLFVCLGNICRSPAAQGIFEQRVAAAGLDGLIEADSAGTAAFNVGKSPDARSIAAAEAAGYDISSQIARQIDDADYEQCDFIIAMDRANLTNCSAWAPKDYPGEIKMFMEYCRERDNVQIPDPYYADAEAFHGVVKIIEGAADALLKHIKNKYALEA